jgi:hypothetical protein
MEITLTTDILGDTFTAGRLSMPGFECDTLEPQTRGACKKVYGFTAIPCGRYKVVLVYSPIHKYVVPMLVNVPDFDSIEIHIGNYAVRHDDKGNVIFGDTKGCILVGKRTENGNMLLGGTSTPAFKNMMAILQVLPKNEKIWITKKKG